MMRVVVMVMVIAVEAEETADAAGEGDQRQDMPGFVNRRNAPISQHGQSMR